MKPTRRERIGVLGGSFDPPHLGHLHVARAAHDELELDRIRLVPACQPPHKRGRVLAPNEDRVAMVELLARAEPWLELDVQEIERGGTSFTFDTLKELRRLADERGAQLYFLVGSDSLVDLPSWHRAAELVDLATFVTVPRDSASLELGRAQVRAQLPAAADRILAHVLQAEMLPISSSQVRARVHAGQPIDELVPRSIAEYVAARGLYREASAASSA